MKNTITREKLLSSFKRVKKQFIEADKNVKQLDSEFLRIKNLFTQQAYQHLVKAEHNIPAKSPMSESILTFTTSLEATTKDWEQKIEKRRQGTEFRTKYNDAFLVYVYGKVKSGKSSLGNYIAWGHTNPADVHKRDVPDDLRPSYDSIVQSKAKRGDTKNEAEEKQSFRVDDLEATNSIQGFKLAGLTWIDSPGLHSCQAENGQLAEEYAQHADLILYTMPSSSPGRATDMAEIKELFDKKKKTLLLITGSDDVEEDVDDNGEIIKQTIMKDTQRQKNQQQAVRKEFNKLITGDNNTKNIEILSFSAKYAQENHDNIDKFNDSGMPEFFRLLYDIAQSESVKIKQQAPLNNFKIFLGGFMKDLDEHQSKIQGFEGVFKKLNRDLPIRQKEQIKAATDELDQFFEQKFAQLDSHRNQEEYVNQQLDELQTEAISTIEDLANDKLLQLAQQMSNSFNTSVINLSEHTELSISNRLTFKKETQEREYQEVVKGTKKRNASVGTMLGASVGFILGGAAAGAAAGGAIGSASGDSASIRTRTVEVDIGDNFEEIKNRLKKHYQSALVSFISTHSNTMKDELIKQCQQLVTHLNDEVNSAKKSFIALQHKINKQLEN